MSNIPQVSGKQAVKALEQIGFIVSRQRGSHIRLARMQGDMKQLVTVPNHKIIRKGTLLNGILNPIHLSLEDFKKLL